MEISNYIIVVAGANGKLGKLVCEALLKRAEMDQKNVIVRALVRKDSKHDLDELLIHTSKERSLQIEIVNYLDSSDLNHVCKGAYAVISTLQGLENIILDVQSKLLEAAIECKVRRFIPSDFSADFTKLDPSTHRNFDLRRNFHTAANEIIQKSNSYIELTSIFQGAFAELLGSGWVLFDYNKLEVKYFGSASNKMEFTTWKNTAEYAAAVALDDNQTPSILYIAGQQITPIDAQKIAKRATGIDFKLNPVMPVWLLGVVINVLKFFKPGKKEDVMPLWVAMQYAYCGALGIMSPSRLDNQRYNGIEWTQVDGIIKKAYEESRS